MTPPLPAALRAAAEGLCTPGAATGLIIAHGTWLGRDDFARFTHHGTGAAAIDREAAISALHAGELPSPGGQRRVLLLPARHPSASATRSQASIPETSACWPKRFSTLPAVGSSPAISRTRSLAGRPSASRSVPGRTRHHHRPGEYATVEYAIVPASSPDAATAAEAAA
jgi:hypothetical protein